MQVRLLAVASAGGHWEQMMLLRPAFEECEVLYVTTLPGLPEHFGALPARIVADCDRQKKTVMLRTAAVLAWHVARYRPHVVFSTGALPGLMAIAFGRLIGSHTIWLDSVANAEQLSMSGRLASKIAHECLSQWHHVAELERVKYAGTVL